ncbi:MAG: 30S ribosomal protein S17 [Methylococcales bacterium]|jgi:small subunit ribosomal protein S17|nr:30S ribosomal protein S17 [Methylococcales bacterium]HIG90824.1 30S ribosomal protein S17 [Methylococcaceae bacterium]MBT3507659.1 30S ribosomal protein S17 [Methylococcales bacterium]MBT3698468.1 30S ribosomal protein S17 [Methylococcales bacterium]MBT3815650.1 30S ribosomal protein S17 [Methylococcales bacterium]
MSENKENLRTTTGRVVSNKMDKTVTISVERLVKHPVYNKYIKRSSKLMAHDANNECQEGDLVSVTSSRPLSKNKKWVLVEVLQRPNN